MVRRRRAIGVLTLGLLITALSFGFGHRGVHAVRSLIVPGAGLYDHRHWVFGVTLTIAAVLATVAWLKWGMDWLVVATLVAAMASSAALAYTDHPSTSPRISAAAHEFPLVVLVMGGLSWLRVAWRRTPVGRRRAERSTPSLSVVDRSRAAALAGLAAAWGSTESPVELDVGALRRRCRRVGMAARGRFGGDPLRVDHAHVRAALSLDGSLDAAETTRFEADAASAVFGVPASEPGWVRIIDGTLAALALRESGRPEAGEQWVAALNGPFQMHRGHRPHSIWTPCALRGPRSATWEHAAATALAFAVGWIHDDGDWQALRTRTLAAAARGTAVPDDERLVAAGRMWLRFVDDDQAARIIGRVTVHRDGIALALVALADTLPLLADHAMQPDRRPR